jgi:hypothetical protein
VYRFGANKLGGAPVWGSRLPVEQKNQAIAQFEAGNVSDPENFNNAAVFLAA